MLLLIPLIRNIRKKNVELVRPLNCPLQFHIHPRVLVIPDILHNPVSHRLLIGIPIRPPRLFFIPNAAIEIVLVPLAPPKRFVAGHKRVVDELRHRAVESRHELPEILADLEISDGGIVIVEEGCDEWDEAELLAVVIEAIPEDRLGLFGFESMDAVAGFGG